MNPMYDTNPVAASTPSMPQANGLGMVDSPAIAREVAQVQSAMIIAKRFPRDTDFSLKKIEGACSREKLANSAVYAYAKGGSNIEGASIRLAEAVATAWGNIKYGFEETDSTEEESTVRAYAYDMEANTQAERVFKVSHVRHTRGGDYAVTDPRDIYEMVANSASRRIRACILQIIPSDVVEYAMDVCKKTREANVKITPETINKIVEAFAYYGITKLQLEDFLQRNVTAMTTTQYLRLRDIYCAIKDGIEAPKAYFKDVSEIKREESKAEEPPKQVAEAVTQAVVEATDKAEEKVSKDTQFDFNF